MQLQSFFTARALRWLRARHKRRRHIVQPPRVMPHDPRLRRVCRIDEERKPHVRAEGFRIVGSPAISDIDKLWERAALTVRWVWQDIGALAAKGPLAGLSGLSVARLARLGDRRWPKARRLVGHELEPLLEGSLNREGWRRRAAMRSEGEAFASRRGRTVFLGLNKRGVARCSLPAATYR